MRRILATLALLLGALHILSAVPAFPGKIQVTQPDGSVITIRIHGDEWYHYVTDDRGQVIARGKDGFFRQAEKPSEEARAEAMEMRRTASRMRAAAAQASSLTQGTHRIPVILVAFKDTGFSIEDPAAAFDALLNEADYSANGGTGSVRDFYVENSHGQYTPVFDVYGPYVLSKDRASYANDAAGALREACVGLNAQVDFSQYDSDRNGVIDMTLMYYAGYNQAESADETTIWPHQSTMSGGSRLDGKTLGTYFCTSELKGSSGTRMCGIGTTTHEFGHSLGLPDFYDTDYELNGEAGALYSYSVMCSGSYNNSGRTPPYLNAEELMILGWMDGLSEITQQGNLTIPVVQNGVAYKVCSSVDGEYFVLECRSKTGWDRFLPGNGLLVYHVDKSRQHEVTLVKEGWNGQQYETVYTAADLWSRTNAINAVGEHPCCYLVPAASQQSLNFTEEQSRIPFPGSRRVTKYTPVDWDGIQADFKFTNISYANNEVTLSVTYTTTPGVEGRVMNTSAKPVRGATVALYQGGSLKSSATTGSDGAYSFTGAGFADATYTVKVSCDGYVSAETTVTVGRKVETLDIYLRKEGESTEVTLIQYDPASATETFGTGTADFAAAMLVSGDETAALAGKQLKTISFQPAAGSGATAAYVFVESGGRRQFTQKVDNLRLGVLNTVSVVAQEFRVPSGASLYIGYALMGCSSDDPVTVQPCPADKMGYYGTYNGTRVVNWNGMSSDGTYFTPVLSATVGEPVQPELGFNHIANPGNGTYAAGDRFDLALVRYADDTPSSVSWTFDGQVVQADAVTLTAGAHSVEAHLTYPDGTVEVIRLVINAE